MTLRCGCVAVVALCFAHAALALEPCGEWQRVFPWPTAASINGVAYGDGRFVAVGNGLSLTSEDGVVWTAHETRPDLLLHAVIRAGERFVAVGDNPYGHWSQGEVAWSGDGASWDGVLVHAQHLYDVAWDGRRFVAVGAHFEPDTGADLLYSDDGESWTPLTNTGFGPLYAVAWGGGVWVVAGYGGFLRSVDGLQWDPVHANSKLDVVWDGRRFVAVGCDATAVSRDGLTWTELAAPPVCPPMFVAANQTELMVGGFLDEYHGVPAPGFVTVSQDLSTWSEPVEVPRAPHDAVWVNGRWVAVGYDGLSATSAHGQSWAWHSRSAKGVGLSDVGANGREVVAGGGRATPYAYELDVLVGEDGINWDRVGDWGPPVSDLSWTGTRWVAVGEGDSVRASNDGREWTSLVPAPEGVLSWTASAGSPGRLVVVGFSHQDLEAVSGVSEHDGTWRHGPIGSPGWARDVVWDGSKLVVAGDRLLAWSGDGLTWTLSPTAVSLHKVTAVGDRLVAVGEAGAALWSDDGRTWSPASSGTTVDLTELTWAGDRFVAGSRDGTLLESPDGIAWSPGEPFPLGGLEGLAWTGRELVGVTENAGIARRRCGENSLLPDAAPRQVIPVVAHRPGVGATFWQSDLHVASAPGGWAEAWLGLVASGSSEPEWRRFMIPPGGQLDRRDLVTRTFGLDAGTGPLLVSSERPLAVSSRTFTSGAGGTYGQAIPALAETELAQGATSVVVPMLSHDGAFRSNLGLVNASEPPLSLEVELVDGAGALLGSFTSDLGPFGWVQHDGVLAAAGQAGCAYAVVSSRDPAARFAAYGSVVDNRTGDPTLVMAVEASTDPLVVPAAAHGPGLAGTAWRSDLEVSNPGTSPASYRLEVVAGDASAAADFALDPRQAQRHDDVLASVFAFSGTAALRVVPTAGEVAVASRTYTRGGGGTFGQGVPALPETAAVGEGERVVLAGLAESAAFRSNLGLVNLGDDPITVTVDLRRGDGGLAGTMTRTVPARSLVITSRVFAAVGAEEVASGYAVVRTDTAGARLLAWASVVDSSSGDPVLVMTR